MASISPTSVRCAAEPHTEKQGYLQLEITSISDSDASTNKRYIGWRLVIYGTPWVGLYARYAKLGNTEIVPLNTNAVTGWLSGTVTDSGTTTFSNDSSGNLTLTAFVKQMFYYYYDASLWNSVPTYAQQASVNMVCSQLPRYANFTKHEVSSKEINKLKITWQADAACDSVQYSLNNGNWTNTSGTTYTISNLSPNTTYTIKTRIRRTDSQLWTTSGTLTVTTNNVPTTNTPGNFNLGTSPTVSINSTANLTKWYVDVYDSTTKIASSGDITTTSKTITLTDSTLINNMLARHPNNSQWTITFKYYCVSNGITYTLTERSCTCSIPTSDYLPIFNDSNISYEVTDVLSLNLTGSNKKVIKGISTVEVSCTPASAQGSATMSKYTSISGNSTASTTNISTPLMVLNNVNANSVLVQATDSRNKTTSITKNYNAYIDYFSPTVNSVNISRIDGIGTNLNVNISGTYCDWQNLTTTNIIEQVSIEYKLKSASTYTTITGVNLTITNNSGVFNVIGNISGNYFVATDEYDVLITLKDKVNNFTILASIPPGESFLWRDLTNKRLGLKIKPEYDLDINGSTKIRSTLDVNGTSNLDETNLNKTSYNYNSGAIPGSKQAYATTIGDLLTELRYTNGQMGSFTLSTAYTKDSVTIATGWYNYLYIPHRIGGLNGAANSDNTNHGTLLLTGMTSDTDLYIIRFSSGSIAHLNQISPMTFSRNTTDTWMPVIKNGRLDYTLRYMPNTKTHSQYNTEQDRIATLNMLSFWNGAHNSSNQSNLTYAHQGTIQCKPKSLYANGTGTTGTVTLSETSANFQILEIFYSKAKDRYQSVRIWSPNGKNVNLSANEYVSGNIMQTLSKKMAISGTSITYSGDTTAGYGNIYYSQQANTEKENMIYIIKVLGYKI